MKTPMLMHSRSAFLALLAALSLTLATAPAWAADTSLSDDQLAQVRQNCKQAQSVLQRLQATDIATRINRGRVYENLLSKLITPFNQRVASNDYDASGFTSVTNDMTDTFNSFKSDYSEYATSLSNLLSMDCEATPSAFYDLLVTTREQRTDVATDIGDLNTELGRYSDDFNALRTSVGN